MCCWVYFYAIQCCFCCFHSEGEESEADSTSREGREGLHKRSSVPHITNDQSVLDMKSVEAAYTKKMADDIKIHHIIEDNMFKPRKAVSTPETLWGLPQCPSGLAYYI